MKKTASLILICILLFNLVGYRAYIELSKKQTNESLETSFNNVNYNEDELIEIKLPINIAYQTINSAYERFDGEVELNHVFYKYVMRKVCADTVYLKCLPNVKKMELEAKQDNYFKNTNDIAQESASKKSNQKHLKINLVDYDGVNNFYSGALNIQSKKWLISKSHFHYSAPVTVPYLPPEIII